MEAAVLSQREVYREVNAVTGTARCVIFGSGMLSELPVAELVRDLGLNISVCNRSVESAALRDAFELMDECVCALRPEKLFLGFGETDISRADFDAERFFADYARLIAEISARCACGIYLIPLLCESERARAQCAHRTARARLRLRMREHFGRRGPRKAHTAALWRIDPLYARRSRRARARFERPD